MLREISFMGLRLVIDDWVYEPSDDTDILAAVALSITPTHSRVLEIGCGCGAISILLALRGCSVVATDISKHALSIARKNARLHNVSIDFRLGDLFDPVSDEKFDTIIFNPPYLPSDPMDFIIPEEFRRCVVGGTRGNEIILRFLAGLRSHLNKGGFGLFVMSSLSRPSEIYQYISTLGMSYNVMAERSFFFERLYVVRVA